MSTIVGQTFLEITSYKMLIEAAGYAGDTETQSVCKEILTEEEAMATWLAEHAGEVTRTVLERAASDSDTAKR